MKRKKTLTESYIQGGEWNPPPPDELENSSIKRDGHWDNDEDHECWDCDCDSEEECIDNECTCKSCGCGKTARSKRVRKSANQKQESTQVIETKSKFTKLSHNYAVALGLREAAIVGGLEYLMNLNQYREGVALSLAQLQQRIFPWEKRRGLEKIINRLKEKRVLIVQGSRTNPVYKLNHEALLKLTNDKKKK